MASVDLQGAITPSKVTIKQTIYDVDSFDGIPRYHGKGVQYSSFWRADIKEILGHEPSFADILLVIGKYWGQDFNVGVNGNKLNMAFIDGSADIVHQVTIISWDLTKPLKDQSPETLQFIADLL